MISLRLLVLLATACATTCATSHSHSHAHARFHAARDDEDPKIDQPADELEEFFAKDSSLDGVKWIGKDPEWFGTTTLPPGPGATPTGLSSSKDDGSSAKADEKVHECFMPALDDEGHLQMGCSPGAIQELTDIFESTYNESSLDERALSNGEMDVQGLGKIFASVVRAVGLNPTISKGLVSIYESVAGFFGADIAAGESVMLVSEEALIAAGIEISVLGPAALALIGGYVGVSVLMKLWDYYGKHKIVPDIFKVHKDDVKLKKGAIHPGDVPEGEKASQKLCGLQVTFPDDFPACVWKECNGDSKGEKKCRNSVEYPHCTCLPEGEAIVEKGPGWEIPDFSDLPDMPDGPKDPEPEPEPQPPAEVTCSNQDNTYIWADEFLKGDGESNLFDSFCNDHDKSQSSDRTEELSYGKVRFNYEKTSDDECSTSCSDAFKSMGETCQENGAIDTAANVEAKCGKFSYEVEMFPPEGQCEKTYAIWFDHYRINWIKHWQYPDRWTDPGDGFLHTIRGCGATTGYEWKGPNPDGTYEVYFNLPVGKPSCVTQKIMQAGGPEIGC